MMCRRGVICDPPLGYYKHLKCEIDIFVVGSQILIILKSGIANLANKHRRSTVYPRGRGFKKNKLIKHY